MSTACIICHNTSNNRLFSIKELQLGLGEEFSYQLCGHCGSMQLLNPPIDFAGYYPTEDYYSFSTTLKKLKKPGYLRLAKTRYLLYGKNKLTGSLLSIGYSLPEYYTWMLHTKAQLNDAILDVGCGSGMLLGKLYKMGFTDLTGIDPFIKQEQDYGAIKILKKEIDAVDGRFDVVMMHHALEHMADPLQALKKAWSLLNEKKIPAGPHSHHGKLWMEHLQRILGRAGCPQAFIYPFRKRDADAGRTGRF
ncbi:MAG: class I SAM-dependent methyltransferase [Chitinophagaceae bacterium]|nr:class I SAM-dependent methyltransferase [Chitinophagaceae bacterium]